VYKITEIDGSEIKVTSKRWGEGEEDEF
jgi:hypothetical protein